MARAIVAAWAAALAAGPSFAADVLPLDQVRPGMVGVGRTVFEGTRVEEFKVQILGVLENVGPKQSMILARLEGGPLERTGVIAGMSGSPVFVDGKLVGAVAYGFPFSKETIAGITPIGEMIEATRTTTPRAASARFPMSARLPSMGGDLPAPLDRESLVAALRRPRGALGTGPLSGLPGNLRGESLSPLALPLVFSGFDPSAFQWAKGVFAELGFAPVLGASRSAPLGGKLPDLEAG